MHDRQIVSPDKSNFVISQPKHNCAVGTQKHRLGEMKKKIKKNYS